MVWRASYTLIMIRTNCDDTPRMNRQLSLLSEAGAASRRPSCQNPPSMYQLAICSARSSLSALLALSIILLFGFGAPAEARLMYGMIDSRGRTILPFRYAAIQPANKDYLKVTPLSSDQKTFLEPFFVDEDGARIGKGSEQTIKKSSWSSLSRKVLSVGSENPKRVEGRLRKSCPKSVSHIYSKGDKGWFPAVFELGENRKRLEPRPGAGQKIGFIDQSGKVKIEPVYESASMFRNDRAIVSLVSDGGVDAAGNKVSWGLVDQDGRMVVSGYSRLYGFGDSFVAAKNIGNSFDAAMWRNPTVKNTAGYSRVEEWQQFLESYNLIGMSRSRVYELLGDPDEIPHPRGRPSPTLERAPIVPTFESLGRLPQLNYHLCNGSCGHGGSSGVQVEFGADDRVSGWRFTHTNGDGKKFGQWVRKNVRFDKGGFERNREGGSLEQSLYVQK